MFEKERGVVRCVMLLGAILFFNLLFSVNEANASDIAETDWVFYTVLGDQNGGAYYTKSMPMKKHVKEQDIELTVTFVCDKRKPNSLYTIVDLLGGYQFGDLNVIFDIDDKRLNNQPAENPRTFMKYPGQYEPIIIVWPSPYIWNEIDKIVAQTDIRIVWNEISLNDKLYVTVDIAGVGIVEFGGTHNMGMFDPADAIQRCRMSEENTDG